MADYRMDAGALPCGRDISSRFSLARIRRREKADDGACLEARRKVGAGGTAMEMLSRCRIIRLHLAHQFHAPERR
jgi:hypothetical protein